MRPTTVFALHFARLLSHLVHDPGNTDLHRKTVDELLSASSDPVRLSWDNWQLIVDTEVLPSSLPGVSDVVARMAAHGVREIAITARPDPAHILGAIWILAREPKIGDGGTAAVENLNRLAASTVEFLPVSAPRTSAPPAPVVAAPPAPAPEASHITMTTTPEPLVSFDEIELADAVAPIRRTPTSTTRVQNTTDRAEGLYQQFTSGVQETPDLVIARLRSGGDEARLLRTLESLSTMVETAVAAKDMTTAARLVVELVQAEAKAATPSSKRLCTLGLRRIATPHFYAALATDLPNRRELRESYMTIFARFGDDGVEALVEQLVYAEQAKDRRVLFDAIVQLGKRQAMLLRLLGDERWYVVRNAVELLGEMRAREAEPAIIGCMRHAEARVRRSATLALTHLGTRSSLAAVREAMRDPSPDVRLQVCVALSSQKEPALLPTILEALDREDDADVQRALLTALGRIGTPDAIKRLSAFAESSGGLFRRRSSGTRIAAVRALAEARTPEAMAVLHDLSGDRDKEVREAASRGLSGLTPQSMAAQRVW